MKVLAVDTATAWQSVAILDDERVLACCEQEAGGAHGKLLLPTIDRVLRDTGLSPAKLDGLVVSIGPGSFTGLRVGLATMLGFRTIRQLPLAVVPTLEGMAWNLRGHTMPLCPVLNSRRGELYWAVFQWIGGDCLERLVPEQVGIPARLGKELSGPIVLYGEGWETEREAITEAMAETVVVTEATDHMKPSAVSIAMAGMVRLRRGECAGIGVPPFYVQRPEAELKYEQSGGISPVARRKDKVARKLKNRRGVSGQRARRSA
ncbi:tRNA (adenosine(37)-N6)-threonylcarbamoyltransferase complex dimerization subunit type 1 TsaB [Petrachloros mirabilis]